MQVSALPPDRIRTDDQDPSRLNIYIYHVTPNARLHNADLPTRNSGGNRLANPTLPLNLHYILTAYGATEFHEEILLGYGMQILHETPLLTRAALRRTLTAASVSPQILPAAYSALRAADLAEQVELVKLTPAAISVDEMSKIWTSLQTRYRTSACYHASVVLIESRRPVRRPLPVLMRGQRSPITGRDEGVLVRPECLPSVPSITAITPDRLQLAARLGERVGEIEGHRMEGGSVIARFTASRERQTLTLATTPGPQRVNVQLPTGAGQGGVDPTAGTDPDNWRCGLYDVEVQVQTAPAPARVTNMMPMVLAPTIVAVAAATAGAVTTFTVQCAPKIRAGQNVALVVGTREMAAEPFGGPTDTVQFRGSQFTSGAQEWVRLRVDGIDSLLVDRSTTPPTFSASDQVQIP